MAGHITPSLSAAFIARSDVEMRYLLYQLRSRFTSLDITFIGYTKSLRCTPAMEAGIKKTLWELKD
jgi:hypothetical protein